MNSKLKNKFNLLKKKRSKLKLKSVYILKKNKLKKRTNKLRVKKKSKLKGGHKLNKRSKLKGGTHHTPKRNDVDQTFISNLIEKLPNADWRKRRTIKMLNQKWFSISNTKSWGEIWAKCTPQ